MGWSLRNVAGYRTPAVGATCALTTLPAGSMRTAARTCASMGAEDSALTLASNLEDPDTGGTEGGGGSEGRGTFERAPGNATKLWRLDSSRC